MSETQEARSGAEASEDYFAFIGLPRRLTLDEGELQQRYFSLSREFHPDFHAQEAEEAKQLNLERSSLLNRAYRTLRDPFERARYLLSLAWPDMPSADRKAIPPHLLMEVMEMQEIVSELHAASPDRRDALEAALLGIEEKLRATMNGLRAELDRLGTDWDLLPKEASEESRQEKLRSLNSLLNTRNYLRTLLATIEAELRGGPGVQH